MTPSRRNWIVNRPDPANALELDLAVVPMISAMQSNGIRIDPGHFRSLRVEMDEERRRLEGEIRQSCGQSLNPGSGDQVAALLFDHLHLPTRGIKRTPSGKRFSVEAEFLEALTPYHPVVNLLLDWSECEKIQNTYCSYPDLMDADGRVRAQFGISLIPSGRPNVSNPNLLAVPVRTDLGKRVRGGFIASPGCLLVEQDLKQIEMVIAAHLSEDPVMLDIFRRGGDIHVETACAAFHLPPEKLDKMTHRYPAKRLGFGVLYEISAMGLRIQMAAARAKREDGSAWTEDHCQTFIDWWYARYRKIREMQERLHGEARLNGLVYSMCGRPRLIPEMRSVHRRIVAEGERKASNHPIQTGAVEVMKAAMVEIWPRAQAFAEWFICRPLLWIHDSLLWEMDRRIVEDAMGEFGAEIEQAVELWAPVRWEGGKGERWSEME